MTAWTFNNEPFTIIPEDIFGFCYEITCPDGRRYLGRKNFWSHRTKKVPGRKNRKHFVIESDWKTYFSSSADLKKLVKQLGPESFKRTILMLCATKTELSYTETRLLFLHDVLYATLPDGSPAFVNSNILGRYFRKTNS